MEFLYNIYLVATMQEQSMDIGVVIFWILAVLASAFYGCKAVEIFLPQKEKQKKSWWVHQFWLNFLGAFVGWLALGLLLRKFSNCIFSECVITPNAWDAVASVTAFIGLTGYLPGSVVAIISGFSTLAGKLAEVAAAWLKK